MFALGDRPRPFRAAIALSCMAAAFIALPAAAQNRGAATVEVDEVRSEPLSRTVPVIGRLVARQSGVVAARIGGPVAQLHVEVGDRVDKGQVIATLVTERLARERDLRQAEVAQAEAALATALAEIDILNQELTRLEGLRQSAAFSQARYEDKRLEVAKAESSANQVDASLERAAINLKLAEIALRDAVVRAPYPGVVALRHTAAGAYLNTGAPVVTLIDDLDLEIEADVPSERVAGLTVGTSVTFDIGGEAGLAAVVRATVPEENPLTRTRVVRFTPLFENPPAGLAVGQSVTLYVPAGVPRDVVSVHKDAVLIKRGQRVVFVMNDAAAHARVVELGVSVGGRFEVLSGLEVGDLAIVRGNERLRDNQKVQVLDAGAVPGSGR